MNTIARTFVRSWMPVIAWMVLIFAGSTNVLSAEHTSRFIVPFLLWLDPHMSVATMAQIHFALRKLGHLTEYAILAALLWRALRGTWNWTTSLGLAGVVLIGAALFAASDEFHQSFIATRTSSQNDVLIDICGAACGLVLCVMFAQRKAASAVRP